MIWEMLLWSVPMTPLSIKFWTMMRVYIWMKSPNVLEMVWGRQPAARLQQHQGAGFNFRKKREQRHTPLSTLLEPRRSMWIVLASWESTSQRTCHAHYTSTPPQPRKYKESSEAKYFLRKQNPPLPQPVHPAAAWQKLPKYQLLYNHTTEQLFPPAVRLLNSSSTLHL